MTGDLVARVGVDSDAAAEVLGPLPFSTSVVLLVFLTGGWLIVVDVPLGLIAISVIPILLLLNVGYQRRIDKHYDTAQHELGALSSAVHESFEVGDYCNGMHSGCGYLQVGALGQPSQHRFQAHVRALSQASLVKLFPCRH